MAVGTWTDRLCSSDFQDKKADSRGINIQCLSVCLIDAGTLGMV